MKKFLKKIIFKKYFLNIKENSFVKKSYSQSGEDLIVKYLFDSLNILKPTYIDIGAHHPHYLSNSALFYENGSRGINVEPDPILYSQICTIRKNDINLNIGIGDKSDVLDFFIINVPTLNTFSKKEAENYSNEGSYFIKEVKKIEVKTIGHVIEKYFDNKFPDFLSLDAEGIDEIIIKSLSKTISKPIVICVETLSFSEKGRGVKNVELIDYIISNGYYLYADTNINSIFILAEKWIN